MLQVSSCRFQVAGFKLQVSSCRFQVAGFKLSGERDFGIALQYLNSLFVVFIRYLLSLNFILSILNS